MECVRSADLFKNLSPGSQGQEAMRGNGCVSIERVEYLDLCVTSYLKGQRSKEDSGQQATRPTLLCLPSLIPSNFKVMFSLLSFISQQFFHTVHTALSLLTYNLMSAVFPVPFYPQYYFGGPPVSRPDSWLAGGSCCHGGEQQKEYQGLGQYREALRFD